MAYNFIITQQEYNTVLQARKMLLQQYEANEYDCQQCKEMFPSSSKMEDVEKKVKLLNSYYSTRVEVQPMVDNIVRLAKSKDLENRIMEGDLSVIQDIAQTNRINFSFATKYCSLLQPDKFPIYDSYVWKFFYKLKELGFFSDATSKKITKQFRKNYCDYVDIYNEFIDKSGISSFYRNYREVDAFIWGACEMYLLLNKKSKFTNKKYYKDLFDDLFPTLLANLLSTAIWEILKLIFL